MDGWGVALARDTGQACLHGGEDEGAGSPGPTPVSATCPGPAVAGAGETLPRRPSAEGGLLARREAELLTDGDAPAPSIGSQIGGLVVWKLTSILQMGRLKFIEPQLQLQWSRWASNACFSVQWEKPAKMRDQPRACTKPWEAESRTHRHGP